MKIAAERKTYQNLTIVETFYKIVRYIRIPKYTGAENNRVTEIIFFYVTRRKKINTMKINTANKVF